MKLVRHDGRMLLFSLSKNEGELFEHLLALYPLIPVSYHRAHRVPQPSPGDAQQVLEEAMAAEKQANETKVRSWLKRRFGPVVKPGAGFLLRVKREEGEWLLQVLNDLRVGSWVQLGCPATLPEGELPEEMQSFRVTMDLTGYFQCVLLEALSSIQDPG